MQQWSRKAQPLHTALPKRQKPSSNSSNSSKFLQKTPYLPSHIRGLSRLPVLADPPVRRLNRGYLYNNRIALAGCILADAVLRLLPACGEKVPAGG